MIVTAIQIGRFTISSVCKTAPTHHLSVVLKLLKTTFFPGPMGPGPGPAHVWWIGTFLQFQLFYGHPIANWGLTQTSSRKTWSFVWDSRLKCPSTPVSKRFFNFSFTGFFFFVESKALFYWNPRVFFPLHSLAPRCCSLVNSNLKRERESGSAVVSEGLLLPDYLACVEFRISFSRISSMQDPKRLVSISSRADDVWLDPIFI